VLEAVASGCLPAVPDRQAYPEIYPREFRYSSYGNDAKSEGAAAAALVSRLASTLALGDAVVPDVSMYETTQLQGGYARLFQALRDSH
jgi:hypothetical protein